MRYVSIPEAAARLAVHRSTIYQLVHRGELAAIRVGAGNGVLRIPEDALARYERDHLVGGAA